MWKGVVLRFHKFFAIFALFCAVFLFNGIKASAASTFYKDNENGVITITYNNKSNAKMKVAVSKGTETYYYNLGNGKNELDIPLNMGNGSYKIRICKNITGTKYSVIQSSTIELNLSDEDEVFTYSNVIVNFESTDAAIKKAASLTKYCKTDAEKVKKIYEYIVKNFKYDYDKLESLSSGYIPDIQVVYKNKKGICYDLSAIMASMLRSQGIKVKLVTGYTPNIDTYHAWNAVYDAKAKKWYTIDTTYDVAMYKAGKKYSMKKNAKDYTDVKYQY